LNPDRTTHFGYREVPETEKAGLVGAVFDSVADRYDIMNDLMSFGLHRLWKDFAADAAGVHAGDVVLDLAAGSGDLSARLARRVGPAGLVLSSDINAAMLAQGRRKLADSGLVGNIAFVRADAERLPFAADRFAAVTIGFGLRNVTRPDLALAEMRRCVKPGGRALVLEFSRPTASLMRGLYDAYSFAVLPRLGRLVTGDEGSYRYLVESIRKHPDQKRLTSLMREAGFDEVRHHNLAGGVVALHVGIKF
jgi:demethylmenaquinone methyltransferase/2-methoxy-6-polyprenyl-1,4-benzoquinol methylase